MLITAPVRAIASTKSVWRARKAGNCNMSQTSATGAACSDVCISVSTGTLWTDFTSARILKPASRPGPRKE
ncbi:MAG: Uncharacterised protein [Halieaceae bacterium]|nr:MAG: Uncharacterised protein [Halieaceae bacterium]